MSSGIGAAVEAISEDVRRRALQVRVLILDVDGVLTDGRIVYDEFGDELKYFDVQDGAGMVLWRREGLKTAIITARKSKLVARRAKELAVDCLIQKAADKRRAYAAVLKRLRLKPEEACAMGDDLMELPILRRAGLAVAVANAVPEVKAACHYVTQHAGGRGAVRETIELILKVQERWDSIVARYSC
jgi:3-deoxy-D-manno-octulosonate 8-phosphate phosphatase (KDO 8-P phosphatase)